MENKIHFVNMELVNASLTHIYSEIDKSFMEGKYNFGSAQKMVNSFGSIKMAIDTLEKLQELIAKSQENMHKTSMMQSSAKEQSNAIQSDNKSNSKLYNEEPTFV
jgi:hypothetical protein